MADSIKDPIGEESSAAENDKQVARSDESARQSISDSGIEKPSIGDITWQEKSITINWSKSNGAIKHVLKVLDVEGQQISKPCELVHRSQTVPMTGRCSYGNTCEFIVEAIAKNGEKATATKTMLIGGDYVATDVIAKTERRRVIVTWKSPKQTPKGFEVRLYEIFGPNMRRGELRGEVALLERNVTWHCFTELKSDTHFRCQVQPIYQSGPGYETSSNTAKTLPRIRSEQEKSVNFGKPESIHHDTISLGVNYSSVEVSWSTVQLGENYVVTGYDVLLKQIGRFYHSTKLKKNLQPRETKIEAQALDTGYEYKFNICTLYKDLDNLTEKQAEAKYKFSITPSQASINDCTWDEEIIYFTWQPVKGAIKYCLTIKDELLNKKLAPDQKNNVLRDGHECEAQIPMSEKLGIGRICMTKVTVYALNTSCESDWKPHLIGGNKVAKNVTASRNTENPKCALTITFDSPKNGPAKEYKVVAIPECGRRKTQYTGSSPFVFEYLRRGVSYYFEVCAKCDKSWSTPSRSNTIATEGKIPSLLIDVKKMAYAMLDLRGATLQGETSEIDVIKGDDFGKVRDLTSTITEDFGKDLLMLRWTTPNFDYNSFHYKIELFKVEVRKPNSIEGMSYFVNFDKTKMEYSTDEYDLELGESYDVSVSTIYEDIDQDVYFSSSAVKCLVNSRPCRPQIVRKDYINDLLTIEWNVVKGAQRYEVELYKGNSTHPYTREQTETKFTQKFDEIFGYGIAYYCVVKAFGAENKFNQTQTSREIIGGAYVPTNVLATIDHPEVKDPNTQVHLRWTASQHPPEKYEITSLPVAKKMTVKYLENEVCLVRGLKAGTHYYFRVSAIHLSKDKEKIMSGGCFSNKILTNPTPAQVKNIHIRLGGNQSTSVDVFWDKVDAEKDNETTMYKVCIETENGSAKQKVTVNAENATFHGLEPDTSYVVTVAGGNSIGFGRRSEKATFKTDFGTPKSVVLQHNATNPSTSLVVIFFPAEGVILEYLGTLYKYSDQIRYLICDAKKVESGYEFSDLEPNSEYTVKVHAVAKTGSGKSVYSSRVMTAPSKPVITEYGCIKASDGFSSREIFIKWKSDLKCDYHEVSVFCENKHLENRLLVQGVQEVKYTCQYESTKYFIQVRSHNTSGHFGEFSNQQSITLAPAKTEGVHAEVIENGYDVKVQCRKAQHHSPRYFMNAYCEGRLVTREPLRQECQNPLKDIIKWLYTPNEFGKKYTFELWGENSENIDGRRTFTAPITSRPRKGEILRVNLLESSSSTNIDIYWKEQQLCDKYEISARIKGSDFSEIQSRHSHNSCIYRGLSPGETYLVAVRVFCGSVCGFWSEEKPITLAPGQIQLIEDQTKFGEPVSTVIVGWKPLRVKPKGYLVKLFCDDVEVDQIKTKQTSHCFEKLFTPGSHCYCTVAGYNGDKIGKATKSRIYKIHWIMPECLSINLDENEPTRKAKIVWDHPTGVTNFKLEIENNQTGVISTFVLNQPRYVFESGIPGNTYSVRLHCGNNGRYDIDCMQRTMVMRPEPPSDIRVIANKAVKGLIVEFKDNTSTRKTYEVSIEALRSSENKTFMTTTQHSLKMCDLVPGEAYKVSLNTLIAKNRSNIVMSDGYTPTFPDKVKNLRSKLENGNIVFEWNPLEYKPDMYIVQTKVNNQPVFEEETESTTFLIYRVEPDHQYRVRVLGSNDSGRGPGTSWVTFNSDPQPPTGVMVRAEMESTTTPLEIMFYDYKKPTMCCRVPAIRSQEEAKFSTKINKDLVLFTDFPPDITYTGKAAIAASSGKKMLTQKMVSGGWAKGSDDKMDDLSDTEKRTFRAIENPYLYSTAEHEKLLEYGGQSPEPPTDIKVAANKQVRGLTVEIKDKASARKTYKVCVEPLKDPKYRTLIATTKNKFTVPDLVPGEEYKIFVTTLIAESRSSIASSDVYTRTFPDKVKNLRSKFENNCIIFEWDSLEIKPDMYIVQRKIDNQAVLEEEIESTKFFVHDVDPNHRYHVRVIALNGSGRGPMTEWSTFKLGLGFDLECGHESKGDILQITYSKHDNGFPIGGGVTEATRAPITFAQPITFPLRLHEQLHTTHVKISGAFTIGGDAHNDKRLDVITRCYCTEEGNDKRVRLLKVDHGKWSDVDGVPVGKERAILCNVEPNKTFVLAKPLTEDISGLLFHMLCRTAVDQSRKLSVTISVDDGVSYLERSQGSLLEQRFTMKIEDALGVKITRGSEVLIDWQCMLKSKSLKMAESVALEDDEMKDDIICSIHRNGEPVSQGKLPTTRSNNGENVLRVKLDATWRSKGILSYVAKSLSSGKEISTKSKENFAILDGIDPGDKYSVAVFELVDGLLNSLIAKSEIQTGKTIQKEGGTVEVGGCILKFPEGAVRSRALIQVCSNLKDPPHIPKKYFCVTSIYDFCSTQKIFDEYITCFIRTPYITVEDPVEVEIICYENHEWQKVSSSYLTKEKTIEFKCNHFSPHVAVINKSFSEIRASNMSFVMENRIYCDTSDNFNCVTCLALPEYIDSCETKLLDRGFFLAPLIPIPIEMKLEETLTFLMKSTKPNFEIHEWEVTLDEEFVRQLLPWREMTSFSMDEPDEGVRRINLMMKRTHRLMTRTFSANMNYPFCNTTPRKAPTTNIGAAMTVNQGTYNATEIGGSRTVKSNTQDI